MCESAAVHPVDGLPAFPVVRFGYAHCNIAHRHTHTDLQTTEFREQSIMMCIRSEHYLIICNSSIVSKFIKIYSISCCLCCAATMRPVLHFMVCLFLLFKEISYLPFCIPIRESHEDFHPRGIPWHRPKSHRRRESYLRHQCH